MDANQFKIAWLAGLIDGDGSFGVYKVKDRPYYQARLRIILESKDKFVLDHIQSLFGGRLTYWKKQASWKPNWSDQWCWTVNSKPRLKRLCNELIPHLVLKKEAAITMLQHLEKGGY